VVEAAFSEVIAKSTDQERDMTNSDETSSVMLNPGARRRFRPLAKAAFASVVAILGVGLFASPAFAHTNSVAGVSACASSTYSITWTITNTYNGPETATVLSVTGGLATLSASSNIAIAANSNVTVTQTLPATDSGTVSIDVQGVWPNPNGATSTATGSVTLPTGCFPPSITVSKSVAPASVVAGSKTHVVYTLAITNTAALTTSSPITVTDGAPAGTTYVAGSGACGAGTGGANEPSCTFSKSGKTLTWVLTTPGLQPGATALVSFAVKADASDPAETIPNTADYTYVGCAPTATCQSNTVNLTVTNPTKVADVTVTKSDSAGSSSVVPGQVVIYTLAVDNTGTAPGTVTVDDAAPAQTTLTTPAPACPAGSTGICSVSVTGSAISWVITNLPAAATENLTFSVQVDSGATGQITNTGTYVGPGCTNTNTNANAAVIGCPTNTTVNPIAPTSSGGSTTTTTTTTTTTPTTTSTPPTTPTSTPPPPAASTAPVTAAQSGDSPTPIDDATTVHTGEPWAGSTPYVLIVLALGLSLLGLGGEFRRRQTSGARSV
jgi:uncharacterized repeat protein (TIGR01451 family)